MLRVPPAPKPCSFIASLCVCVCEGVFGLYKVWMSGAVCVWCAFMRVHVCVCVHVCMCVCACVCAVSVHM